MARAIALRAEVTRGAHKSLAEMMLPDAIDDDTWSQWIRRVGNRLREFQSSGAIRKALRFSGAQDGNKMRRRRFAGIIPVAANPHLLLCNVLLIRDGLQVRVLRRHGLFQFCQFAMQSVEMFLPGCGEEAI